jgi:hypothetical protein
VCSDDSMQSVVTSIRPRRIALASLSLATLALALATSGCAMRVGSKTIAGDRFDYASAITRSWKEQMLLNMVKLRYLDPPVFLDIAQVVASYTLEGSASLNAPDWTGAQAGSLGGASGRWAESPTITYNPMTGERFIRSLMKPVAPASLLSLVQAGWPVDGVLALGARSINGLHGGSRMQLVMHAADPNYYKVLALMRELQVSGQFGLRIEDKEGGASGVVTFRTEEVTPELIAKALEVKRLLRLDPDAGEFRIAFGAVPRSSKEIAFQTRSMLEILGETAMGVEVPASDVAEGRAVKVPPVEALSHGIVGSTVRVQSSPTKPPAGEAYASVRYRDRWFYVSDRDLSSKRGISFMMTLFALADSGASMAPPVLTISKP